VAADSEDILMLEQDTPALVGTLSVVLFETEGLIVLQAKCIATFQK